MVLILTPYSIYIVRISLIVGQPTIPTAIYIYNLKYDRYLSSFNEKNSCVLPSPLKGRCVLWLHEKEWTYLTVFFIAVTIIHYYLSIWFVILLLYYISNVFVLQILLRQKYHDESARETIRVQVRLPWIDDGLSDPSWCHVGGVSIESRYRRELSSSSYTSYSSSVSDRTIEFATSIGTSTTPSATTATSATLLLALPQILSTNVA